MRAAIAAGGGVFLRLAESEQPETYKRLVKIVPAFGTPNEVASIVEAYQSIPSADFFDEIVALSLDSVTVKELSDVGWWDLSEPSLALLAIQRHLVGTVVDPVGGKADYNTSISFLRMHYEGLAHSHRSGESETFL